MCLIVCVLSRHMDEWACDSGGGNLGPSNMTVLLVLGGRLTPIDNPELGVEVCSGFRWVVCLKVLVTTSRRY